MQVPQPVLEVLSAATFMGSSLVLNGQLDRKLYTDTNKVLEAAGGKWDRKLRAHIFPGDAADVIEPIILSGEYTRTKTDFGQFDSPPEVVARVIELAQIESGMTVLEPSAGIGNLAVAAAQVGGKVMAWEIDPKRHAKLAENLEIADVVLVDALQQDPDFTTAERFDRVVMNPPFARQADIDHVLHAHRFLKPDGRLVSVMSAGVMFRQDRKAVEFRAWVEERGGIFERLPDNSFKASGTSVNTCIVVI